MSAGKKLVLITGANSGIGFELCRQLLAKGQYHIFLGSRSVDKGNAAIESLRLEHHPGSVELVAIDMTSDETIDMAAKKVEDNYGKLDVLICNAAIATFDAPLRQQMRECFDTNASGVAMTILAFAPLLQRSTSSPRIINVSSGSGSISLRADPSRSRPGMQIIQYKASKAAQNMVSVCAHVQYAKDGIKVFAFCPGFTATNLSAIDKAQNGAKPADEAVRPLVDIVEGRRDEHVGKFLNAEGIYPW